MKLFSLNRKTGKKALIALLLTVCLIAFTGVALAASDGGHGGEAAPVKKWAATDTYRVINFTILVVALFFVLRKPVAQGLNNRIANIKNELEDLESKKEIARKQLDEYNARLTKLDEEAEKIIADYQKQGEAAKAKILESAKASAEKIEAQAKRNIENEFDAARQRLKEDIFEKAIARAESLVKEKITADDQNRLVDEYLEKVVLQ
ncbi:MAG: ATP synthase F0 subunit B [Thermodesulfobacteriota bacterium]|nr:ATP synthase F0 subunit B [Thermodesulfobacteriota bacterium]